MIQTQIERTDAEVERLVMGVDKLVWQLAWKMLPAMPVYVQEWMDVEDLYGEAMVALCAKARMWDPDRSRFTTYAYTVVWSHLLKFRMRWMAEKRDSGPMVSLDAPVFADVPEHGGDGPRWDISSEHCSDIVTGRTGAASGYEDYVLMDAVVAGWFDAESAAL